MPEVHHILDLLIEQKLTHVQIAITTNLTNVNKEFLNKLEKFEEPANREPIISVKTIR